MSGKNPCYNCGATNKTYKRGARNLCISCATSAVYPHDPTASIGEGLQVSPPFKLPQLIKGERTVGIEIEAGWKKASSVIDMYDNPRMQTMKDGSLRGADAVEVISDILTTSNYRRWLDDIDFSSIAPFNRAGIHVWVGTPDYTWQDMNALLYWCKYWQWQLINLCPVSRNPTETKQWSARPMHIGWTPHLYRTKTGFLRSLYGTKMLKSDFDYASMMQMNSHANDGNSSNEFNYPGPINRTWWLNVHGHFTNRKAIEIRLLHTTNSRATIEAWIDLWTNIIDKVRQLSASELRKTPPSVLAPPQSLWLFGVDRCEQEYDEDGEPIYGGHYSHATASLMRTRVAKELKERGLECP